jgi:hypothetical protein
MRLPGLPHAHYRSLEAVNSKRLQLLHEAEQQIRREIAPGGGNVGIAAWWQALGLAQVMRRDAKGARMSLEQAERLGARGTEFDCLFGAALFEAGADGDHSAALAAVDRFTKVLDRQPSHLAARFNRAHAFARLGYTKPAQEDVEVLLRSETDPLWRAEAEVLLSRLANPPK